MTNRARPRVPSQAFKVTLLVLAAVGSLALVEIGLRYRAHLRNEVTLEAAFSIPEAISPDGRVRFIDIIRPHPNDRIIYELRPSLDVDFKDARLSTNSHGFRGPEYPVLPDEDTITIVGIGGSIMFGHGVADGEEFPVLLTRALRERHPEKKWRFVNTSAPSYNVVMKVEVLKAKGLRFQPDLVILEIASNNLSLPNYIRVQDDPLDLGQSFLLGLFRGVRARRSETRQYEAALARVEAAKLSWSDPVETERSKVPAAYRGLIGWPPFYEAFDELQELSRIHGFEVVVFAHLNYGVVLPMLDEARERGFHTVTSTDEVIAYLTERDPSRVDVEGYTHSELVVSPSNLHPSALQHRMVAARLLADMTELGVIDRLLAD